MNHFVQFTVTVALLGASHAYGGEAHSASIDGTSSTFGKLGPYTVLMSEVSDQGLLLVPHSAEASKSQKKWPGLVFAHGLCGPARSYSDTLERRML